MISCYRVIDKSKFRTVNVNSFDKCSFFYPFLRQGIFQLMKNYEFKTVALPFYVAEGIYDPFLKLGFKIKHYDIDANGNINKDIFNEKIDVFVYVHLFGLYNEINIQLILRNKNKYSFFMEDFAHSVYSNNLSLTGDVCIFSFPKTIGVIDGACILFNKVPNPIARYSKSDFNTKLINIDLYFKLLVISNFSGKLIFVRKVLLFAWSKLKFMNYYSRLMNIYATSYPTVSFFSKSILDHTNFKRISDYRISFAEIYLDNLNKNILFDIPRAYYLKQALFSFPIKVNKRDVFMRALQKENIVTIKLYNNWCFGKINNREIMDNHVLLPLNQNLKKADILRVIHCVNKIYEEQSK